MLDDMVYNKDVEKESDEVNLKHWVIRTVLLALLFITAIVITEFTFQVELISNTLMVVGISVTLGLVHEYLHYYQAVKLGYKPEWYRTRFTMGFEISHKSNRGKWLKDKKKISLLPYYVLLPVSVIILIIGLYLNVWGIWVGGVMGIILHTIAYPLTEGH